MQDKIHFGAVYFRKTNPPRDQWEQDFKTAADDGQTLFRHWVPWGVVETSPGKYDWDDYDRILDLSAKYNIKAVLAEMVVNAPEWMIHKSEHARREDRHGRKRPSLMHVSCATGGSHVLCLDNKDVREAGTRFLQVLASRYKDHPGFFGYDVWNECSFYSPDHICHCAATEEDFREWLKSKYGDDPKTIADAWFRYSYTSWSEVRLPREINLYPDVLDAIAFQVDNAFEQMQWRIDTIRAVDPKNPITAHGNGKSFSDIAPACGDDWRAGELVDLFGYTYWYSNRCHVLLASDMTRSAADGKEFWRAEAIGDHEWIHRDVNRREVEKDEMHEPENIRLDCLTSLAAGASAYMTPRWRPLLDGPLVGSYGWYGMDGSRSDRSKMIADLAVWANGEPTRKLWSAQPVVGDVGLVLLEESQAWCYAFYDSTDYFSWCYQGAWEAFTAAGLQCDPIKPHQIDTYRFLYIPFPLAVSDTTADRLRAWVERGGTLVSEACFGYFDERGHAQQQQPNRGFEDVFGCHERSVSLAPDRWWPSLSVHGAGLGLRGAMYRQAYQADPRRVVATFDDGQAAIVENRFGEGRTLLVGTLPSAAYHHQPDLGTRQWFASLLELAHTAAHVRVRTDGAIARLWESADAVFLWVINEEEQRRPCQIEITSPLLTDVRVVRELRGRLLENAGRSCVVEIEGRDAGVIELKK